MANAKFRDDNRLHTQQIGKLVIEQSKRFCSLPGSWRLDGIALRSAIKHNKQSISSQRTNGTVGETPGCGNPDVVILRLYRRQFLWSPIQADLDCLARERGVGRDLVMNERLAPGCNGHARRRNTGDDIQGFQWRTPSEGIHSIGLAGYIGGPFEEQRVERQIGHFNVAFAIEAGRAARLTIKLANCRCATIR